MKNAFDQKKFDAIVKKAFEAAPDQSRESLTNIAQDLMKSINQVHDEQIVRQEELEKAKEQDELFKQMKELEKKIDKMEKRERHYENLDRTIGAVNGAFTTLSTHIQSAITICTTAKDKLISTIEKTGKEFRDNAEKARRTKELNKEKAKEMKDIDDKITTAKATKKFYDQEYTFYDKLTKNCEQSLEKLNEQKEKLIKTYEQTNERASLIKNGFKNLIRGFKGQDAQTLAESGDRTHLFEGITSKVLEKINADIEKMTAEKESYQKKARMHEIQRDAVDYDLEVFEEEKENIIEKYEKSFDEVLEEARQETYEMNMETEKEMERGEKEEERDMDDDMDR